MANSSSFYGTGNELTRGAKARLWLLTGCLLTGSLLAWSGRPILPWWWQVGLAPLWVLLVLWGALVLLYVLLVVLGFWQLRKR